MNISKILIVAILTFTQVNAIEVSIQDKISSLYISFFNRAADIDGLTYWIDKANNTENSATIDTLKELSAGFAQHPTFTSTYTGMNNKDFVEAIYQNSLARDGDIKGINYWSQLLDSR